jgi:DNA-binding response OmpR family regulator
MIAGRIIVRVLVIEDEVRLAANIARAFRDGPGFAVDCVHNGSDGLALLEDGHYDLAVVDLMLPGIDGAGVVRCLRNRKDTTPVLILTACDDRLRVVELLNAGADDYLTKPFDLGELLARTKALIRRSRGVAQPIIVIGSLQLNSVEQTVHGNKELVELSPTEYRILEYLMFRPRAIVSKRELLEHLYDFRWEHHSNVIEAHVSNLRKKLRGTGVDAALDTIRGRGYRLGTASEAA